jgi:hypothetical protein
MQVGTRLVRADVLAANENAAMMESLKAAQAMGQRRDMQGLRVDPAIHGLAPPIPKILRTSDATAPATAAEEKGDKAEAGPYEIQEYRSMYDDSEYKISEYRSMYD